MPLIEWTARFMLGIPEVDKHHKYLVWLFNKVYDEYMSNAAPANISLVIKELTDYAAYHFEAEERWMNNDSYPKLAEHQSEHVLFSKKVKSYEEDYNAGKGVLLTELFVFLEEWVNHHILGTDGDYGRWLKAEINKD